MNHYFALFDLPVAFDIDTDALDVKLHKLQQVHHPDQTPSNDTDKHKGDVDSAIINEAYRTLKNVDSRAQYLLQLNEVVFDANRTIADDTFLQSAMVSRVAVEESNDTDVLRDLLDTNCQHINTHCDAFVNALHSNDYDCAIDATQKLKFLVKLNKDIKHKLDVLMQTDDTLDSDDDLYL